MVCSASSALNPDALSPNTLTPGALSPWAISSDKLRKNVLYSKKLWYRSGHLDSMMLEILFG